MSYGNTPLLPLAYLPSTGHEVLNYSKLTSTLAYLKATRNLLRNTSGFTTKFSKLYGLSPLK
jgi:hypothetical protein